eukprot:GEMP01056911.1.p1 GENE.GEMP01056911.1~~GEMP01056911.1.p1  ORF type:complete len:120 (-),score=1.96 GEMP01056911.1:938-1297(-)
MCNIVNGYAWRQHASHFCPAYQKNLKKIAAYLFLAAPKKTIFFAPIFHFINYIHIQRLTPILDPSNEPCGVLSTRKIKKSMASIHTIYFFGPFFPKHYLQSVVRLHTCDLGVIYEIFPL